MNNKNAKIFASSKVSLHQDRIDAYLNGENIYPITVEMDLTQTCTRDCPQCPYSASRKAGHTLQLPFLEKLFSILGPHTPGIVLSGGEPTFVPHFPQTLALAREKGFKEIAVISNGTRIHLKEVQDALLKYATSIRISMYDWQDGDSGNFRNTLMNIQKLKDRAKNEGSRLEIGAAMLTRREWNERIRPVGLQALSSGIDWLYFHPFCIEWEGGYPVQADQSGVIEAIEALRSAAPKGANIQVPYERYSKVPLSFSKLHGAHFLIQIGADGVNYAGPECKYHEEYALLDLNKYLEEDFLWHPQRIERQNRINSGNYRVIGTKHRPPMFSDYIEKELKSRDGLKKDPPPAQDNAFLYPEII
jgi:organic radical activating enzyme